MVLSAGCAEADIASAINMAATLTVDAARPPRRRKMAS
jgi:hypothetical protein